MIVFVFLKVVPYRLVLVVSGSYTGPTSWAAPCVKVESNLSCFLVFRSWSRASCACLSLLQ